jgi:hypothetical protein
LPILAVGQKAPPENRIIVRLWRVWHKSFFVIKRKRRCRGKCPSICELYVELSSEQGSSQLSSLAHYAAALANCFSYIRVLPSVT